MIFNKLLLYNYGPYLGEHSLDLTPVSNGVSQPIILIGGLNGCGKTSLLDAIRLVLYGKRARCSARGTLAYKEFLLQCINRSVPGEKTACIELSFQYESEGRRSNFSVRRTWFECKSGVEESLLVLKDGEIDIRLAETWDERIEEIIPLGVSNLFLFDGEQVGELANQESTPEDVRSSIQSLIGLELVGRLEKDLDSLMIKSAKCNVNQQNQAEFADFQERFENESNKYNSILSELSVLKEKLNSAQEELINAENRFVTEGGELAVSRKQLDQKLGAEKANVDSIAKDLRDLAAGPAPLALLGELLMRTLKQAQEEIQSIRYIPFKMHLEKHDDIVFSSLNRLGVSEDVINKLKKITAKYIKDKFGGVDDIDGYLGLDEQSFNKISYLVENKIPSTKTEIQHKLKYMREKLDVVESLDAKLSTAATPEDMKNLVKNIERCRGHVIGIEKLIEEANEQKAFIQNTLERTKAKLRSMAEDIAEGDYEQRLNSRILREGQRVKETLERYRSSLMRKKIEKLENLVTKYYKHLMRKKDFIQKVIIKLDSYDLVVCDNLGEEIPKRRLSSGEKQLLAVAFLWGLAEASGRSLPLVIDTPLGRLDSKHRNNLIEQYFPLASHQVIIFSTDTEIHKTYIKKLRSIKSISREYILKYDDKKKTSSVNVGYFC